MAGEIDTSIALRAGQPAATMLNPLEVARQGVEYRNALLGNKIRQSEYDSQMAAGNALLGNTDATGNVNWDKARGDYAQSARSNPSLALGAADNFSANNTARSGTAKASDDELAFQEHARDAAAGAFIRTAQNPSDANIRGAGAFIAHLTPGARGQIAATTRDLLALPTAQQRSEAIKTLATATLPGHERINQAFGTPTSVDDGQTIQTGTQASGMDGGAFTPAAGVQRQISPETNSSPMEVINPDGSRSYVRRDQVVGGAKPTVPPEAMGSGRYPAQQPANPGYQAAPAAGQTEALAATAKAGADGANALMQASANRNDRMAMLGNMSSDLEGFNSGPGYENLRHLASVVDNWTGATWKSDDIQDAQSFNKWAQNLANAQSQALGTGTDSKLAAAVHASPNSALQSGTNRLMIHQLQGNEDAINAKAQAWKASGMQPAQFQQWNQQFSQSFDPRAFQMIRMTPEERSTYIKGLKKSGQFDELKNNYNAMAEAGLVPSGRP
ncbi:hypothetical protein [Acetobacter phage phiAX1]|nr:hypothetical protein [Acetobacter phage phiAX1]